MEKPVSRDGRNRGDSTFVAPEAGELSGYAFLDPPTPDKQPELLDYAFLESSGQGKAGDGGTAEPIIKLSSMRFALSVLVGNAVFVGFMVIFLTGITLKKGIMDPVGSSAAADKQVERFQTINGYFAAIVGMLLEWGFEFFIAVMLTCLGHAGSGYAFVDREGSIGSHFKTIVLFGFGPAVFFVLNVGISAMNIQHSITGVSRAFVQDDLVATTLSVKSTNASTINIKDTIMRPVVLSRVVPFDLLANSSCITNSSASATASSASASAAADAASAAGEYVELPTVKEIRSTAVVFGFPAQSWNYRALPDALTATHSVNVTLADLSSEDVNAVAAFQESTDSDFGTLYELFLQGKTLLERTVSDANVSAEYPCSWVDGKYSDDLNASSSVSSASVSTSSSLSSSSSSSSLSSSASSASSFAYFDGGEYDGMRVCNGAVSSLQDLANMTDGSTTYYTLDALAESVMSGLNKTVDKIAPDEIVMTLESFQLSRQMSVLSMTLTVPLVANARYRDVSEYCDKDNNTLLADYVDPSWTADELAAYTAVYCTQDYYPYDTPRATCGATNCIFLDKSELLPLKKQILMLPYLTNCSVTNMTYDSDYLNFLPHGCKTPPNGDAVFLYGLGTYISGDTLDSGVADNTIPYIILPRRYITLSFAKLQWTVENVSAVFNAQCNVSTSDCGGLVHVMKNLTAPNSLTVQALIVSNASLPSARLTADFRHPVPLVTLNSPPFYYKSASAYYEWEYLNQKRFTTVNWNKSQSLSSIGCSVLIDSYIEQLETNHYYLDEPLQSMYASALFYLFQNAAVKTVKLASAASSANFTTNAYLGEVLFDGDRERKQIKYSIPIASAVATYAGIGLLLVLAAIVLLIPQERVKLSDTENLAARYAEILVEEDYPGQVHRRQLALPNGDKVDMDDYHAESIDLTWPKGCQDGEAGSVRFWL